MVPIEFGVKRSKVKHTGHRNSDIVSVLKSIILSIDLESPYHIYGLLMSQRCSLSNLGLKGQRSSALGIKVAIWFLGSSALSFLPY